MHFRGSSAFPCDDIKIQRTILEGWFNSVDMQTPVAGVGWVVKASIDVFARGLLVPALAPLPCLLVGALRCRAGTQVFHQELCNRVHCDFAIAFALQLFWFAQLVVASTVAGQRLAARPNHLGLDGIVRSARRVVFVASVVPALLKVSDAALCSDGCRGGGCYCRRG